MPMADVLTMVRGAIGLSNCPVQMTVQLPRGFSAVLVDDHRALSDQLFSVGLTEEVGPIVLTVASYNTDEMSAIAGTSWAWCHDGHHRNGRIKINQDMTTESFSNSTWRVSGRRSVTVADVGGAGTHVIFFN